MNRSEVPPRLMMSVTGVRGDTLAAASTAASMIRSAGFSPSVVLTLRDGDWTLREHAEAVDFFRSSAAEGCEVMLGGMGGSAVKAEFDKLGHHEANLRLTAAMRQCESLDLPVHAFAPSRWLMSKPSLQAAASAGLDVAADAYQVYDLHSGATRDVRVLAFGDGFGAAKWWRRNVRNRVRKMIRDQHDIRLSLSSSKAAKAGALADMNALLDTLRDAGYQGASYRDFVGSDPANLAS